MNNILTVLDAFTLLGLVKILMIILFGVYAIFAGLIVTQVGAMNKAVVIKDGFIMRILGLLHFAFAILVLLMAIFIL